MRPMEKAAWGAISHEWFCNGPGDFYVVDDQDCVVSKHVTLTEAELEAGRLNLVAVLGALREPLAVLLKELDAEYPNQYEEYAARVVDALIAEANEVTHDPH